jgi:cytochrome c biogenesis protein CcmG/thiol:disulfide interchange protein DsbE
MQPFHRRLIYALLLAAGLVWIWVSADRSGASTAGRIPAPRQDFLAPDFTLQTLTGESVRLSDLRGQAVLVNLWATWCPPCRAEMPVIQKMYEEYKGQGFTVLAIDMAFQDDAAAVQPFVEEYRLTFPVLLDPSGATARQYELRSLPTSFFIDRQGVIREVVIGGPMSEALLRTRIETILQP